MDILHRRDEAMLYHKHQEESNFRREIKERGWHQHKDVDDDYEDESSGDEDDDETWQQCRQKFERKINFDINRYQPHHSVFNSSEIERAHEIHKVLVHGRNADQESTPSWVASRMNQLQLLCHTWQTSWNRTKPYRGENQKDQLDYVKKLIDVATHYIKYVKKADNPVVEHFEEPLLTGTNPADHFIYKGAVHSCTDILLLPATWNRIVQLQKQYNWTYEAFLDAAVHFTSKSDIQDKIGNLHDVPRHKIARVLNERYGKQLVAHWERKLNKMYRQVDESVLMKWNEIRVCLKKISPYWPQGIRAMMRTEFKVSAILSVVHPNIHNEICNMIRKDMVDGMMKKGLSRIARKADKLERNRSLNLKEPAKVTITINCLAASSMHPAIATAKRAVANNDKRRDSRRSNSRDSSVKKSYRGQSKSPSRTAYEKTNADPSTHSLVKPVQAPNPSSNSRSRSRDKKDSSGRRSSSRESRRSNRDSGRGSRGDSRASSRGRSRDRSSSRGKDSSKPNKDRVPLDQFNKAIFSMGLSTKRAQDTYQETFKKNMIKARKCFIDEMAAAGISPEEMNVNDLYNAPAESSQAQPQEEVQDQPGELVDLQALAPGLQGIPSQGVGNSLN